METSGPKQVIVVGAGAAGLMAALELGRAGKNVIVLEARDRCGGRIYPLPSAEFGYAAEGGAEFVHGEASVTRGLLQEAGLSVVTLAGTRWRATPFGITRQEAPDPEVHLFYRRLADLTADMTVVAFLDRHFAGPEHERLRQFVTRMVEGYDAADPARASMMALRDEWTSSDRSVQGRIVGGYAALIAFLETECIKLGVTFQFNSSLTAIGIDAGRAVLRCTDDEPRKADAAILTLPPPLLNELTLPPELHAQASAAREIGFGSVIKILLRFANRWWSSDPARNLADLSFLLSDQVVPVWWTQHPSDHPVLTGWIAGPRTKTLDQLEETALIETGITSLAKVFGCSQAQLMADLIVARAINWGRDPLAKGAYSYATPETKEAQKRLRSPHQRVVLFSGEAVHRGPEIGTVEAALAAGRNAAHSLLQPA